MSNFRDGGRISRWFETRLDITMDYLGFAGTKTIYPDGQISYTLQKHFKFSTSSRFKESVIWCSLESYEDLFCLMSFAEAASNHNNSNNLKIYIPCLFGQRSDRRFNELASFDLKTIARCINSCNFAKVYIFDPHSDVSLALIDRSVGVSPKDEIANSVFRLSNDLKLGFGDIVLVSPDAGAYKKTYGIASDLGLDMVASNKVRLDDDINITVSGDVIGKNLLIVDDLADGGYTFKLLSKELRHMGAKTVSLYVSHGLFTKGFDFPDLDTIFIGDTGVVKYKNDR